MQDNSVVTKVIERSLGFDKYKKIKEYVHSVDVSKSKDSKDSFQTLFNSYYAVRRDETWREGYYEYFQCVKEDGRITFNAIIDDLYKKLKTKDGKGHLVEASFSSKMLATINPKMPILDSRVLKNMGLSIKGNNPEEKLQSAKKVYKEIWSRYQKFIKTENCKTVISIFDIHFPDYSAVMSDERKIDWFLWAFTKDELTEIGLFGELLCANL